MSNDEHYTNSLKSLPNDWANYTKEEKIKKSISIIQYNIQLVSQGNFDVSKSQMISALCLDVQFDLSECYADAEMRSKQAKNLIEYIESEVAANIKQEKSVKQEKGIKQERITETEIKRISVLDENVKQAKTNLSQIEKEFKKWKYMYDTLREAHIFFRNLTSKV